MRLYDIDLTDEEYYSYYIHEDDDVVDISFQDTEIMISSEAFNRLKEEIIGNEEGLSRVEVKVVDKTPKRETLVKLMKTIDEVGNLVSRYEEKYLELMTQQDILSSDTEIAVRKEIYPLYKEKQEKVAYMKKLEAQLKYEELQ